MKKYIVVSLLAIMLVGGLGVQVYAADTDNFTITAQVNSTLTIATSNKAVNFAAQGVSTTATMVTSQGVLVTNTSTVSVKIAASVANSGSWVAAGTAAANAYVLTLVQSAAVPASDAALASTCAYTARQATTRQPRVCPPPAGRRAVRSLVQ